MAACDPWSGFGQFSSATKPSYEWCVGGCVEAQVTQHVGVSWLLGLVAFLS